ncbi:MAG: right-handed parallel beta-helix repeat-containing protein [Atribacterota bacterium]
MKKFFIILFVSIAATVMGGCLNLASIFPVPNVTPIIISVPIITATEDQLYSYQVKASDPNGDTLTYSFTAKPEGMGIDSESGLISWTPANDQVGIHRVVVEISDGKQSVTQDFEVEVFNVNNPPQIFFYFPTNINIKINEGSSVKFEIQARDIDLNTILGYQWLLNGKKVSNSTVSGDGSKSSWIYSVGYGDYSQKIVKVLVHDGELQDYVQWNITINDITLPVQPTLGAVTSPTNIFSQTLSGAKEVDTSIWINGVNVVPLDSSVNWSYSYNLSEGFNDISITSRDIAGNESSSITTTILLDTGAPAAPALDAVVSPTNISPQTLSGIKEATTSILINNTVVIPVNSSTTWTYDFNLSEGENNISITSKDSAGNESSKATIKIILDSILPTTPTLNEVITPTNISIQALSGTKETNSSIWINGVEVVSLNLSTVWSYSYNFSEGNNNISVTSRDTVGNESSAVLTTIEYDPNIYVDIRNTSGIEDGTQTHPFNSIIEGIDAVAPGKSVIVDVGTYKEQLIIARSITLRGASRDNTFITGSGLTGNLITIEADYVTITGFTVNGTNSTAKGIYFDNCSSININNNTIQNNVSYGINYSNSSPTIECNDIKDNDYSAIDIAMGGAGIIRDNFLINNLYGIRSCGDSSPEITGNNISNNNTGIYCRESATPIISYNTISNNTGYGILIDNLLVNSVNPDIGGGDGESDGQNKITGNFIHGINNKTTHNIYAKYNWWGDSAGPKYPYNPDGNAGLLSDWAYWDTTKKQGPIDFSSYLSVEP